MGNRNQESKQFVFKVGIISAVIISILLIGTGLFIGIFLFAGKESGLSKNVSMYKIYDSEIYGKQHGDKVVKELILNYGKDINETDENNIGGLYWAIKHDNVKAVRFLIENEANIEIASDDGTTPLVLAIEENNTKMVEILIEEGNANIYGYYIGNNTEKYPIYCAIKNTNLNIIKILINNSFDFKKEPSILNYAIANSDENTVKYLIENGADINYKNSDGTTILYDAVLSLSPKLVNYFLEKNANIDEAGISETYGNIITAAAGSKFNNPKNKFPVDLELLEKSAGNSAKITDMIIEKVDKKFINDSLKDKTPLIIAVGNSYLETVKKLIENGANVNKYDDEGWSALTYAANNGDIEIAKILLENNVRIKDELLYAIKSPIIESRIDMMKLLIENRANINYTDENGLNPLNIAVQNGDVQLTKFLMTNKANANILMPDGSGLIEYAITQNNMDLLQVLVENGADIDYAGISSLTPLMVASKLGLDNVVRILLARKIDINAIDINGNTALHLAAGNSRLSVIRLLLDKNPNLDIQNNDGNTALHLAVISGNIDIVGEIVLKGANTRIRNNERRYPMDIARVNNSAAIFEVLREAESKDESVN